MFVTRAPTPTPTLTLILTPTCALSRFVITLIIIFATLIYQACARGVCMWHVHTMCLEYGMCIACAYHVHTMCIEYGLCIACA